MYLKNSLGVNMFKTISENATSEVIEKKSKFIAEAFYVETAEEAEERIREVRKNIMKQNIIVLHIVYIQKTGRVDRFSDDGEPSRNSWCSNAKYT